MSHITPSKKTVSSEQFWKSMRERATDTWTNAHGNLVWTLFLLDFQRYTFDFTYCTREEGWRQFDTDQDAWYFGIWVHDARHHIVTYAEGDLLVTECADHAHFVAELEHMHAFYGAAPPAALIVNPDEGQIMEVHDMNARRIPMRDE